MGRTRSLGLAVAVVALAVVAVPDAARSASSSDCLGGRPNVVGTSGSDRITVDTHEDGATVTVNGRTWNITTGPIVVWSKGGRDTITFRRDSGPGGLICSDSGDDTIDVQGVARIHAGDGYDSVVQYLDCGISPEVFRAEVVRTSYDRTDDVGPCN